MESVDAFISLQRGAAPVISVAGSGLRDMYRKCVQELLTETALIKAQ